MSAVPSGLDAWLALNERSTRKPTSRPRPEPRVELPRVGIAAKAAGGGPSREVPDPTQKQRLLAYLKRKHYITRSYQ